MKTRLILLITIYCFVYSIQAQKPFTELGLDNEVEVITLSNGRYIEHVENDTLRQIGSVMFNMNTNKVEYFIPEDDLEKVRIINRDREVSRFMAIDPLAAKYSYNSPYAFSENIVIHMIELEGLEAWEPKWSKLDVMSMEEYSRMVKNDFMPLAKTKHKELLFDCNNLALFVVMKYFETKNVEFNITFKNLKFSSSDEKYEKFDDFYEAVRKSVGSDLTLTYLSDEITPDEAVAGDMDISGWHTYVLLGPEGDNSFEQKVISASGGYYGKNDPKTWADPIKEKTRDVTQNRYYFRLARWNVLSDVPNVRASPTLQLMPQKQLESGIKITPKLPIHIALDAIKDLSKPQ